MSTVATFGLEFGVLKRCSSWRGLRAGVSLVLTLLSTSVSDLGLRGWVAMRVSVNGVDGLSASAARLGGASGCFLLAGFDVSKRRVVVNAFVML